MKITPIVTDTFDFPTLIKNGNVYVDKTSLLHRLVSCQDGYFFFISRPRRFGKSLMISTLEQIFLGNKELFKGLDIYASDYDWTPHPVLRLDMSRVKSTSAEGYSAALCEILKDLAKVFGVKLQTAGNPGIALGRLLDAITEKGTKAVVLIDEYDAPVGGLLDNPTLLNSVRTLLHDFYSTLKSRSGQIRFLMMTGVSKFTKLSVFSGMNNLTDLSMSEIYASLLGYTHREIERFFAPHLQAFAAKLDKPSSEVVHELLSWYNNYRFSPESDIRVSNPVSIGRALQERRFYGFWNATGNSSLIVERLRRLGKLPDEIENLRVYPKKLDVCDAKTLPLAALMYQGGYLTIKDVLPSGELVLGIPNREVRSAIYDGLVDELLQESADSFTSAALRIRENLATGTNVAESVRTTLASVFAMVPHEWKIKSEAEAKRYFLLFMKMAGADICVEEQSSKGRADAVLKTPAANYIFEFKYGKTARSALKQIADRHYADPYQSDGRPLVCIGVNYNPKKSSVEIELPNKLPNKTAEKLPNKLPDKLARTLSALASDPDASAETIAETLNLTSRSVREHIKRLKSLGYLTRIGSNKFGHWEVKGPAQ